MTEDDLYELYKLHQVDARIVELKQTAADFDPTRPVRAKIDAIKPDFEAAKKNLEQLSASHTDLELKFKSLFDKLNNQINYLYSGKVVNAKESEALEKDIESLRDRADQAEQQRVAVAGEIPGARAKFEELNTKMDALKRELAVEYQKALKEKERLQSEYKELVEKRKAKASKVLPSLAAQYDAIRVKYNGIGMGVIVGGKSCGACGTILPTKSVLATQEGKLVTCEACHRILFHVLPYAETTAEG
jgi:predicted  nucleic acid-binding Zn-ribbon protein